MSKRILTLGLPSLSLVLLLACGGGSTPATPTATSITYTNPTAVPATSYYLNKNAALSTPGTHLVLDLCGPATTLTGSGVVLTLSLDTAKATWSTVPVINGGLFTDPIVKSKLSGTGNGTLQVVVTERGFATPKAFGGPLLQIALDLKTGQSLGTAVTLTPDLTKSQALLGATGTLTPLSDLRVGSLTAQ